MRNYSIYISYGGIMKGWKWKCESTQICFIFTARTGENTSALLQNIKY